MALTTSITERGSFGNMNAVVGTIAFDSSYPTGGEALTAGTLGLSTISFIIFEPTGGLTFEYDHTNATVIAYEEGITTGSTAAADSTSGALAEDIAGAETVVRAMGTAIDTTYRFGALRQCAATTDLSGTTGVNFFAIGF